MTYANHFICAYVLLFYALHLDTRYVTGSGEFIPCLYFRLLWCVTGIVFFLLLFIVVIANVNCLTCVCVLAMAPPSFQVAVFTCNNDGG